MVKRISVQTWINWYLLILLAASLWMGFTRQRMINELQASMERSLDNTERCLAVVESYKKIVGMLERR